MNAISFSKIRTLCVCQFASSFSFLLSCLAFCLSLCLFSLFLFSFYLPPPPNFLHSLFLFSLCCCSLSRFFFASFPFLSFLPFHSPGKASELQSREEENENEGERETRQEEKKKREIKSRKKKQDGERRMKDKRQNQVIHEKDRQVFCPFPPLRALLAI